jgi:hypothetical protein
MEGSTDRWSLPLTVERGFECSRLENELLASAYERLIPILRRRLSGPLVASSMDLRQNGGNPQQRIAKGA